MEQVIEKNDKNESYKFFLKEVGSHMREYRKMQGITQAQMARKLGMAFVSYNSIERGVVGTTLKTLFNIAQLLEISPARLLSNKDEIFLSKMDLARLYNQEAK